MAESDEHDDLLFAMLKDCKTLPVFLNHIFGFLSRRTDFYQIATEQSSPVGLPPGLSEQIVKQTYYKWRPSAVPPGQLGKPSRPVEPPLQKPQPNDKFTTSDAYNGAVCDTYSWSQALTEVDVIVRLPNNTNTKDLVVQISPQHLTVKLKSGASLLDGGLCEKCKHNDAIWSVQRGSLNIHLDKCKEIWWNCLTTDEPKLDVSKLDCSRPFEELPEEAQAKIEELQWNQERKRLGLPTSDQMGLHSILKESWHAEGSPFCGSFDPTSVKLC